MDPDDFSKLNSTIFINQIGLDKYWHFIKWGTNPESIIEVGIGDGRATKQCIISRLPDNIKEYIGADLSTKMLDFSKTAIDYPKYRTVQMDICSDDIPLEYLNKFDKVFSCLLLHMVNSKIKEAFTNFYQLLKPGGQLIYTAFPHLPIDEAYEKLDKTKWSKFQHSRYMSAFWNKENPYEEYKNLTKEVGFQEDIIGLVREVNIQFPKNEIERGVLKSVNYVLKDVPSEEYQEYFEDYVRFYQNSRTYYIDEKTGESQHTMQLVVGIATKPL